MSRVYNEIYVKHGDLCNDDMFVPQSSKTIDYFLENLLAHYLPRRLSRGRDLRHTLSSGDRVVQHTNVKVVRSLAENGIRK